MLIINRSPLLRTGMPVAVEKKKKSLNKTMEKLFKYSPPNHRDEDSRVPRRKFTISPSGGCRLRGEK
jgi:hypothetical protein